MDLAGITIGVGWIILGLVNIGLALPLLSGSVRPNALYGVRFRQSFHSDDAWFAINRYGAKRMIVWALPMIAVGAAVIFMPLKERPVLALLVGLAPLLFVFIPAFDSWHFARRYTEKR